MQLTSDHDCAVIEIGTNRAGEIFTLTNLVQPTAGLITNIGLEHLEMLVDIDGVEIEETTLFELLIKAEKRCFINYDDERLQKYKDLYSNSITYGLEENSDYHIRVNFDEELHPELNIVCPNDIASPPVVARLKATGLAYALNSIAASAVGWDFGLTSSEIAEGLENFVPVAGESGYARMVVERHNN